MDRTIRRLSRGMQRWFLIDSLLVFITGIQLFVLTGYTDQFFAWTISHPLTAAFLGAAYWASLPLVYLSSRQKEWARARVAVFGVLIFTVLMLAATLIHLDRFHLFDPGLPARLAAWVWLAVYVVVPPALVVLPVLQMRVPGGDPVRQAPLPGGFRAVLAVQSLVLLLVGVILFILPSAPVWPWQLTPLTGRAVAAWLVGIGAITAHVCWENDWGRVHAAMIAVTWLGLLELLAVVRYPALVAWNTPHAVIYVIFLLSLLAVGCYGWFAGRRAGRHLAPGGI
jgi:hypothetical protein